MDKQEEQSGPQTIQQEPDVDTTVSRRANNVVQFPAEFDWKLSEFNEENAIKNFSKLADGVINAVEAEQRNSRLYIAESAIKGSGISKANVYILRGEDSDYGKIQIVRKYSDFYELRQALLRRWPGILIPPVPEKGNIGANEKQIAKNKVEILNNFLRRIVCKDIIFAGEDFQTFIKSPEGEVAKNLQKLKPQTAEQILTLYKSTWAQIFGEVSEEQMKEQQQKIKRFQDYFMTVKVDLVRHKDEMKRLAELRSNLNNKRYQILSKTLPEYEGLCLNWFNGIQILKQKKEEKQKTKPEQKNQKQEANQNEEDIKKKTCEVEVEVEVEGSSIPSQVAQLEGKVYSSLKYQEHLQAEKQDIFQEKFDEGWIMYELFKFEIREIEAILQTVTQYRYLINQKKYYTRNVENNRQQIEDINNKKMSLKIFFLSGSEDDKKTQLANQTMELESKLKITEEVWNGVTQLLISEIENFQIERCDHYKRCLLNSFKKEALLMSKLFNLYVQAQKL